MKKIIPIILVGGVMALAPYALAQETETPTTKPIESATPAPEASPESTAAATETASSEAAASPAKKSVKTKSMGVAMAPKAMTPRDIMWTQGAPGLPAGAKAAVLAGDPARKGPCTIRLEAPNGYKVAPHSHPATEYITVISGTYYFGMGHKADEKTAQKMPAGSFVIVPAHAKHYSAVRGKTVIQIQSTGPMETNYVNSADDPRHMAAPAMKKQTPKKK